jgi:hypothetical protein
MLPRSPAAIIRNTTMAFATVLAAALSAAQTVQTIDTDLIARKRLFPSVSGGVTAIHRDAAGRYAILTEHSGVLLFDAKGEAAGRAPADPSPATAIQFGADMDLDEQGRMYVADRARNVVDVFGSDGRLQREIHILGPTAVATLAGGEVAVASLRARKLVTVFGADGQVVREFGEPEQIAGREDLNRYANIGRLCRDTSGRLYYSFTYLPEPTVRRYDRFGYSDFQLVLNTDEYAPSSMNARKAIAREDSKGKQELHVVLGPVAVDPTNGEIWLAIAGRLLRFYADGMEHGSFLIFTPGEERIEATAVLVEADRIVVASSHQGVFALPRPAPTTVGP